MIVAAIVAAAAFQQVPALVADSARQPDGRMVPRATATRITGAPPHIDGRLDDPAWTLARPLTGFTQQEPDDGAASSERTEVRILYDDQAIYVAARLYDAEPERVVGQLARRDVIDQSDAFYIGVDSYHDHQTSFLFIVTPSGTRADATTSGDFDHEDYSWDPVWEGQAARDSLGWTAETRIPLSQLRFPAAPVQTWGIAFGRYIQRKGEIELWPYWPRTAPGFASNFGHLEGLEHLPQPRRLELLPYVAGNEERLASGSPGNPFNDGSREVGRAGLDAQYGVTSNLTLNATFNPDFGQVEADPAVVNLTAYETFFQERRPFFVEGAGIFSVWSPGSIPVNGPQFLYSRRIGRAPQGGIPGGMPADYVDMPGATTILSAAKLSGRTAGGWSIGMLDAVTATERATLASGGARSHVAVEPFTNYAALRAKRDYHDGATTLGVMATAVNRRIDDTLLNFLRTSAWAGGVDFGHRFSHNAYSMFATFGGSYVTGDTLALQATQHSSARYFQRPDARHHRYDPTRTSLAGWYGALGFAKDQGAVHLGTGIDAWSPGLELNDLGALSQVGRSDFFLRIERLWNRPGRIFRTAEVQSMTVARWNFDGDRTGTWTQLSAGGDLHNYWSVHWSGQLTARSVDDALLRGGPVGIVPAGWWSSANVSTDYRRRLRLSLRVSGSGDEAGGRSFNVATSLGWRPAATVLLEAGPALSVWRSPQQYLAAVPDSTAARTYGVRYVFGGIRQHQLDLTSRLSVTLSPTLSLQLYAQPYVNAARASDYREFVRPRSLDYIVYGKTNGSTITPAGDSLALDPDGAGPRPAVKVANADFNFRSLRGNAVLRWEYRPGSTLFLVWTQSCSASGSDPAFAPGQDLRRLCQGRANNVFAIKLNYWISI